MRKLVAALFLLITGAVSASDSGPHWLEVKSAHFDVFTDAGDRQARHVAAQLEQMRTVFRSFIPAPGADGPPIIVLAFKDRKGFQALEPSANLAKGQLEHVGYFLRTQDKNYILLRLDTEEEHPFAVVYHEYTHFILRKAEWLPLWLNEGLAEFYQNTDIHEKEVLLGQPSFDDVLYLRQNRLLPLTTLFAVDYASPYYHEEQKGSVFYAQSWALTHFLMVSDHANKTTRLHDYMVLLSKGQDPVTAAQNAFGDLKKLQQQLDGYVSGADFKMFAMKAAVTIDESQLKAEPIPTVDADAVRADVLVNNGRIQDAQAVLDNILRNDPKNALAYETMGYLKFREGDIPAARKWYGEAVQLGSPSYLAQYYFAVMSLQAGGSDNDDAIEASLLQAIKLNPDFAPSYDTLAGLYARHHEKLDQAHILNVQAVQLEPENLNYRLNTAQVLIEEQQLPGAVGVLNAALKVAKTPEEIASVQQRIDQAETYQASLARAKDAEAQMAAGISTHSVITMTRAGLGDQPEDAEAPKYPTEEPTGKHHNVKGMLSNVHCYYPAVITFDVDQGGKKVSLYRNNYYKIVFSTANYTPTGDIKPCTEIQGMKASVDYAEVSDKTIAGQIVSIELSK